MKILLKCIVLNCIVLICANSIIAAENDMEEIDMAQLVDCVTVKVDYLIDQQPNIEDSIVTPEEFIGMMEDCLIDMGEDPSLASDILAQGPLTAWDGVVEDTKTDEVDSDTDSTKPKTDEDEVVETKEKSHTTYSKMENKKLKSRDRKDAMIAKAKTKWAARRARMQETRDAVKACVKSIDFETSDKDAIEAEVDACLTNALP